MSGRAVHGAAESPDLVTIPDVPIVSTGTYALSTGEHTFTEEDLLDALRAMEDPACHAPRLKIGHLSKFGDGEPAFGKVVNCRVSNDNQTLVGDYVGVPRWLAELMPVAYPSRSIEGKVEAETMTGNKYGLIIEAVSLLGVVAPGVSTLADLPELYGTQAPAGIEVKAGETIHAKEVGGDMGRTVAAAVETEDIRRSYYESLSSDQMWWWIRAIRIDPQDLIVDDDDGHLFRVPYTVDGEEVSFSDPVEVQVVYVDVGERANAAIAAAGGGQPVAVFASREESRPESTEQEESVDSAEIRSLLGLPETATDEEVRAEAERLKGETPPSVKPPGQSEGNPAEQGPETGTPSPTEDPSNPTDPSPQEPDPNQQQGQPQEQGAPEPVAASGLVQMDAETAEQLRRDAAAGREARDEQIRAHRASVLDAAQGEGRFPESRRQAYERAYETDPEGTERLLTASVEDGGLAPGLVPVKERGSQPSDGDLGTEAYPSHWLPEVQARRAANGQGESRVINTERAVS